MHAIVIIAAGVQLLIDPTTDNVISTGVILLTSAITFELILVAPIFLSAPLPAMGVLGYNVATLSGALLAQSAAFRSVIYNLENPLRTFLMCAAFQPVLILSLYACITLPISRAFGTYIREGVIRPLAIFSPPSSAQIWIFGGIGLISMGWTASSVSTGGVEFGDIGGKFFAGFTYLAFTPFLLPIYGRIWPDSVSNGQTRLQNILVSLYLLLLIAVAAALNSRGAFATGVANLLGAIALLFFLGRISWDTNVAKRLFFWLSAIVIVAPIFTDISTAMLVVRGYRNDVSAIGLVSLTYDAFLDKDTLKEYRSEQRQAIGQGEYNESYVDNPFLSRFIQVKYFDNMFSLERNFHGDFSKQLLETTFAKTLVLLPTPILSMLPGEIEKNDLAFSFGDQMRYLEYGSPRGSYITGSFLAHGYATFGIFIFIVAPIILFFTFVLMQSMTEFNKFGASISTILLIQIMTVYYMACGDSLLDPLSFCIRTIPQSIFLYALLFGFTSVLTRKAVD